MRFFSRPPAASRALTAQNTLRSKLQERYPTLMRGAKAPRTSERNALVLGKTATDELFLLPQRARLEHMFCVGTTGGGKSKFLELCIRQDIARGHGVLVVDPHGEHPDSLYRSVLSWMKTRGHLDRRRVHLIDPSSGTHTVGFNPLTRPSPDTDLSVSAGVTLEAFSRVWGGEDTSRKPTIERVITAGFSALAELNLTLVEAPMLLDREDKWGLRKHAIATLKDRYTREELVRLDELARDERRRHDFDAEVVGPINRLARFVRPNAVRTMIGQTDHVLDIRAALDEGHVILCNLSGSERIYETDADLLGRLLTRMVFFHAKRRQHPERPFFVYLDECHRYLSGDLENILAESRKYGLGVVLATQWLEQLRKESENMLAAVLNATNVKVVFRPKDPREAEQLAEMVVPLDLERPVAALVKPTIVGYGRTRLANESVSEQRSKTTTRTTTRGESETHSQTYGEADGVSGTESTSESKSTSETTGTARSHASTRATNHGCSMSWDLDPNSGYFSTRVLGLSRSASSGASASRSSGDTQSRSHSAGTAASSSFARTTSSVQNWSEGYAFSRQWAVAKGAAETSGESRSRGSAEALEPLLYNLPSAVHSKDNVRYMAAHAIRSLRTGRAVVNFVGEAGMVAALLRVPFLQAPSISGAEFKAVRALTLSQSTCALPLPKAQLVIEQRERALLEMRAPAELAEPETFRVAAPEQDRSRPAGSGRRRSRQLPKT